MRPACDRRGCGEPAAMEIMRWNDGIRTCRTHYDEALALGGACLIHSLAAPEHREDERG